MVKKVLILMVLIALFFSLFITVQTEAARVAIIGFEADGIPWTDDAELEENILRGITREFNEKLHQKASFDVVDSSRVNDILRDSGYRHGQKLEPTIIPHLSRVLENNLLIIGSANKISASEGASISIGPIKVNSIHSNVELSARLIDANTGNTLATFSGQGESTEGGLEIDEIGGITFESDAFADSAVGKAITRAIEEMTDQVIAETSLIESEYVSPEKAAEAARAAATIEGSIVDSIGGSLVLDIGSDDGLSEDLVGKIVRVIDVGSDEPLTVSYGEVKVSSVDNKTAIAAIIQAEEDPVIDDTVRFDLTDVDIDREGYAERIIDVFETQNFVIYIESAVRVQDRVTISGTVEAINEGKLTAYIPRGFEFYDHKGAVVPVRRSGTKVQLGNTVSEGRTSSVSGRTARATETILPGYPKFISWSFNRAPEDADHLARISLNIETDSLGEMEIKLERIPLISY